MAAPRNKTTWSRKTHQWLGILLVIPILLASVTGIILNHTVDLGLSNRHVTADWILSRYGMTLGGEPEAFGLDGKAYAASWDGRLFHRGNTISDDSPLVAAVPLRDGTAVVTSGSVHYFGLDGELIETLGSITLPQLPITRAGRTEGLTLVLETESGTFSADANLLGFTETTSLGNVNWSTPVTPSASDRATWKAAFLGTGIPLDRVILDIHSGRFFGSMGKWVYDVMVIGVLFLSVTGIVLFFRTRRRARAR